VHYKSEEVKQGNFYIVNGQHQPRLTVAPGELVRLRLINAGGYLDIISCVQLSGVRHHLFMFLRPARCSKRLG
jgi:hypothetical protein